VALARAFPPGRKRTRLDSPWRCRCACMARVFVATSAPEGWSLGRWRQVSEVLWEEQKLDGSQEIFPFEVLDGPDAPGSNPLKLRLVGTGSEAHLLENTIQVFAEGQYLGEYAGEWETVEEESAVSAPPEMPAQPGPADMDGGASPQATSELAPARTASQSPRSRRKKKSIVAAAPQKWPPLESPKSPSRKVACPDASPETVARLTAAAGSGDLAALQDLLKASADPDAGSALLLATEGGHLEAVKALVAAGADVNITQNGNTAMTLAYQKGHQDILRELFSATFQSLETAVVGGGSPTALNDALLRKLPDSEFDALREGMVGELHGITERIKELGKVQEPEPVEAVAAYVPTGEVVTIGQLAVKDAMTMIVDNMRRPATAG